MPKITCTACSGGGYHYVTKRIPCSNSRCSCRGCPKCNGRGYEEYIDKEPCRQCHGQGYITY